MSPESLARAPRTPRLPVVVRALFSAGLLLGLTVNTQSASASEPAQGQHAIGYDHYSLVLDGQRVMVQAGEFHYFRLPSPSLWRDVLEKYKAAGMNAISVYFNWAYHSPKPGVYDFTGVRDVDRFLRLTEELGLYVIARPGPYINAETTGGGFPAWLKRVHARARSSDPGYTAAYREWLSHINPILATHQFTNGGSIILYNVENEYAVNTDPIYMQDLQDKARADGIVVPITHNACCDAGSWSSSWGAGPGAVDIPGVDDYPQSFDCAHPDSWGPWGEGLTERLRDNTPVYAAEYQAGAIDANNAGYDKCRQLTGPNFMKFFYKSNIIKSGATLFSYYMVFGGTNWGWLAQPNDVQTSYDYGAAIDESRQLSDKYDEFKRQGYFLKSVAPLTKTDSVSACTSDNTALEALARANPDTGTQFVLVRHADRAALSDDAAVLDCATPDGRYQVPVGISGRKAQILIAGYDLGGQRLVWSNSEIMTHAVVNDRDVAVLYGTEGVAGSTVLRYLSAPSVKVLEGAVTSTYDQASGDLRLDYEHSGLARVQISGGGRRPLLLFLGTDAAAASFWQTDTNAGPILVRGTSLVRSATVTLGALNLRADNAQAGPVEVFGPARRLLVNGVPVAVRETSSGSLIGWLPEPNPIRLPELNAWRTRTEAPEALPGFDDSRWTVADKTTTESPMVPKTLPVLYTDEYGFHYGTVWYRGHFTASGTETQISLNAITGKGGIYMAWLNGRYLGWADGGTESDLGPPANADLGRKDFPIPTGVLRPGQPAIVSVLVENMGHNDDWTAEDIRHKQPRGLVGASLTGSSAPIAWKIQGARGGEDLKDIARGPLNNGGLFGERAGWHLPDHPDHAWRQIGPLSEGELSTPIAWYRTRFGLSIPVDQDVSIALRFSGDGSRNYRVLIFLNGWAVGQYQNELQLARDFQLPAGILRHQGDNTLALAVLSPDGASGGPGPVSLVGLANHRANIAIENVDAPEY